MEYNSVVPSLEFFHQKVQEKRKYMTSTIDQTFSDFQENCFLCDAHKKFHQLYFLSQQLLCSFAPVLIKSCANAVFFACSTVTCPPPNVVNKMKQ